LSLTEYVHLLRRWGWILVLVAMLTAGSAYVLSKAQTPVYKSTILVGVQPTRPDLGLTESAKTLLRFYVAVINSTVYAQKVIDAKQLDREAGSLLGDVTIASDESRWTNDLTEAVRLAPDHLSTYCLTFEEDTALFVKLSKGQVKPDPEREATMYRRTWKSSVISSFVAPLFYVLAMGVLLGGFVHVAPSELEGATSYLAFVVPGLIAAQSMQTAGLISYRRGTIQVLNRGGLEKASCECYSVVKDRFDEFLTPPSTAVQSHSRGRVKNAK